jgi:GNAT superfamily N-acetyltransferase
MSGFDNKVTFEKVNSDNFEEFINLIQKLAEYEKLSPPNTAAKSRLRRDCLSKDPKIESFLVRQNNAAVAYVIFFFTYSSFLALPSLFLEDIFVLEEYRKQGIGGKIIDFCKAKALEKGCGRIELAVLDWNKPAQKFYEDNKAKKTNWYFYRINSSDF